MQKIVSLNSDQNNNNYKIKIVWRNVIVLTNLHVLAVYGYFLMLTAAKWQTICFTYVFTILGNLFGITAGAHRLWSHRSFKATFALRLLMMIGNTIALQNDIYEWCRDHRVHHKYTETDADPHNSKRGFFFAHIGWLLCRKHPAVIEKGKNIDMSDIVADPIVRFQRQHYYKLVILFWFLMPTVLPNIVWRESFYNSFLICVIFRYIYSLNSTWLVNSAAHIWGHRPYDNNIEPKDNDSVVYASFGEGYHNYHHTFPWDYSTSELGWKSNFNLTTVIIDLMAWIGLAYDLKTVPKNIIKNRKLRTGDGSHLRKTPLTHWIIGIICVTWVLWVTFLLRIFSFKYSILT